MSLIFFSVDNLIISIRNESILDFVFIFSLFLSLHQKRFVLIMIPNVNMNKGQVGDN